MRVAFSTVLSVAFAASALAIPAPRKRHEELEIITECTTVVTTEYATVDPTTPLLSPTPVPSNPPVGPEVKGDYEWPHKYTTKPTKETQSEPPPPKETAPDPAPTVTPPPPPPVDPTITTPTTTLPPAPPVTTPTPAPTTAPPASDGSFESIVLNAHNEKRALHGAPPLTYDATMASFALGVSGTCERKHSGGPYGENLAIGYASASIAIQTWYDENTKYNYTAGVFSTETGHFTQMVWKGTKTLGCGLVACGSSIGDFLTCEYNTGNVKDFFKENVLPPIF